MTSDTNPLTSPVQSVIIKPCQLKSLLAKLSNLRNRVGQGEQALADCKLLIEDMESEITEAEFPPMYGSTMTADGNRARTDQSQRRAKGSISINVGQAISQGIGIEDLDSASPASTPVLAKEKSQFDKAESGTSVRCQNEEVASAPSFSARANGPTDRIPGMKDGSGGQRVLPKERGALPTMIHGNLYSCEAKCGYPDWACEMIRCDSAKHPKLPASRFPGNGAMERSWYHKPCGGMSVYYFPEKGENFTCPSCARKVSPPHGDYETFKIQDHSGEDGLAKHSDDNLEAEDQKQNTPESDSSRSVDGVEGHHPSNILAQLDDNNEDRIDSQDGANSQTREVESTSNRRQSHEWRAEPRMPTGNEAAGDQNLASQQMYVDISPEDVRLQCVKEHTPIDRDQDGRSNFRTMNRRPSIVENKIYGQRTVSPDSDDTCHSSPEIKYEKGYILYDSDDDHGSGSSSGNSSSKALSKKRPVLTKQAANTKHRIQSAQTRTYSKEQLAEMRQQKPQMTDQNSNSAISTGFLGDEIWKTNDGDPWIEEENVVCIQLMREICEAGEISGEGRFIENARRMKLAGYNRNWTGIKNAWNRRLRARSNLDERRKKGPIMATSKQDKETKRMNREKKKERGLKQVAKKTSARQSDPVSRSWSPKRDHESDDKDERTPPKRRRAATHQGNFLAVF